MVLFGVSIILLHGVYNGTLWGVNYLTAYCMVVTMILSEMSIILLYGGYNDTPWGVSYLTAWWLQ